MTELLIKLFVKNNKDTKNTKVRLAYGNLAGIVGILCNVLLFAGKYISERYSDPSQLQQMR